MHTLLKHRIIALAEATPDREVCGFFIRDAIANKAVLYECVNVAANPAEEFEIGEEDYMTALGRGDLLGIYHSHPKPAAFSPEDLDYAQEIALPQYLYSVPDKRWYEYISPTYKADLIARPFTLGFGGDCFGLVRDYYRQHFSIYLNDYDRDESFLHEEQGVIMANFEREGFMLGSLATIQAHDILMFHSEKALPQHFAIYLGHHNLMLHQPLHSLSREEMVTGRWLDRLVCVFRYGKHLVECP